MSQPRLIMHVDMNSYFASVEQAANPRLRGKPIAVVGGGKRTVITTSSYEARAFGVKTGMTLQQAQRLCPELIRVVADNRKYTYTSARITAILQQFSPLVEVFSIDEAFLDISGSIRLFGSAERIAYLIKAEIRHHFHITCSVGIGPNKLIAKLASEMKKPDGLTLIPLQEVPSLLERTPVADLCGIGSRLGYQLLHLGIQTCGDLGRTPPERLEEKFGIIGLRLHQMGRGIDDSPVVPAEESEEVKSVSHSMTLDRDIEQREEIMKYLLQLSEMVGRRARAYGLEGKTVTLFIRFADYDTWLSKQQTQPAYVSRTDELYSAAVRILDQVCLWKPLRLLGVRLSSVRPSSGQMSLFGQRQAQTTAAMDEVNNRYGNFTVTFGSLLPEASTAGSYVISPAWRPEGVRHVDVQ